MNEPDTYFSVIVDSAKAIEVIRAIESIDGVISCDVDIATPRVDDEILAHRLAKLIGGAL